MRALILKILKIKQLGITTKKEKIYIFDTTLRDGAQTEGVDFSLEDKNKIANALSNIGIDYIEVVGIANLLIQIFSNLPKMHGFIYCFCMTKKLEEVLIMIPDLLL